MLAIDITDLPDARVGSIGEMATLIAPTITIDEVAEATRSTGREVLTALGSRFLAFTTQPESLEPYPMQNEERAMFGKSKDDNDQLPSAVQQTQPAATQSAERVSTNEISTISRGMTVVAKILGRGHSACSFGPGRGRASGVDRFDRERKRESGRRSRRGGDSDTAERSRGPSTQTA